MQFDLTRKIVSEALGTMLLVATVVGSGIMADNLTDDVALALLGNTLATGAILVVLITIFGPVSGAHFNPAVSLVFTLSREMTLRECALYVAAQVIGGVAGTLAAHLMFVLPLKLNPSMSATVHANRKRVLMKERIIARIFPTRRSCARG